MMLAAGGRQDGALALRDVVIATTLIGDVGRKLQLAWVLAVIPQAGDRL